MSKYIIGIDVSKKKLDAFCSYDKVKRSFDNNESGIKELCTWLKPMEKPVVVYEPTAHHHRDLEAMMMVKNIGIVRADPYRVRKFAEAKGQLAKTDDIDAEMIANAAIALELPCTQIKEKELQQLQELCTQRRALIQQRAALSNMTKTLTMPELINNNNNLHGELARLALQQGCKLQELGGGLERVVGGRGVLLGGVPGVVPAKVVIVGGGVVGSNATEIAVGMGARVVVLDRSLPTLRRLHERFGARIECVYSTEQTLTEHLQNADLVVGAVLIPGASAPKLIRRSMLGAMLPGSVVVDVAIDQGGCLETARATTYADPTYVVDDIVHYCVANMPGGVPRTSTIALNNSILPHALRLAEHGLGALRRDPHLAQGLNVHAGKVTYSAVAEALNLPYVSAEECLG